MSFGPYPPLFNLPFPFGLHVVRLNRPRPHASKHRRRQANSRTLACLAATVLFLALATPIRLAAQVGQEQDNNQTLGKNLNTLEDTNTMAECSSEAGFGIAHRRPADQPPGVGQM